MCYDKNIKENFIMKVIKKLLVLLPLTALLAGCNTGNSTDHSALPSGGEAKEIIFGSEEDRKGLADGVEAFASKVMSSSTFELSSKGSYGFKLDVEELKVPVSGGVETFKGKAAIEDVEGELKAGVSFKDDKLAAYLTGSGSGSLEVGYELPDSVWGQIPQEVKDYGLLQKNSDSFKASDLGVDAYVKDGKVYVNADKQGNRKFVEDVLSTKLIDVKKMAKEMGGIEDISKMISDMSLKYVFENVVPEKYSLPFPSIPEGYISNMIVSALAMINNPGEEYKEYVDMAKDIISTLTLKTYVYSKDSGYSYGFEFGVENMEQVDSVYSKVKSYIPSSSSGKLPSKLSEFLKGYGFDFTKFSFHVGFAFGVDGKLFFGANEDIEVKINFSYPVEEGKSVSLKGEYGLSADLGVELTASDADISSKIPSNSELAKFEHFALPVGGAKNSDSGVESR